MDNKEIIQIKTRELYHLLLVKDIDILFAHRLFNQIYNVIWYRHLVQKADTPESTSLARWSLESARDDLNSTLYSMNLCDLDVVLVRWIANHCEFNENGK